MDATKCHRLRSFFSEDQGASICANCDGVVSLHRSEPCRNTITVGRCPMCGRHASEHTGWHTAAAQADKIADLDKRDATKCHSRCILVSAGNTVPRTLFCDGAWGHPGRHGVKHEREWQSVPQACGHPWCDGLTCSSPPLKPATEQMNRARALISAGLRPATLAAELGVTKGEIVDALAVALLPFIKES